MVMSSLKDEERAGKGREVAVSELLAKRVAKLSLEKKCEEAKILDLRGLT